MGDSQIYSAEERAKRKFNSKWLDCIPTPFGHIFSVFCEELDLERPKIFEMMEKINEYISIGGNGFAKITEFSKEIFLNNKVHMGLQRYIQYELNIPKERKEKILQRIEDELKGITPEDRRLEGLSKSLNLY